MNIAKKYLEQAYIGYHRIICYDLMIKGIQEDLSKFNNDKIIYQYMIKLLYLD